MNLFGIGGVGLMQFATGRLHRATSPDASDPGVLAHVPYQYIFLCFGVALLLGASAYLFSRDNMD